MKKIIVLILFQLFCISQFISAAGKQSDFLEASRSSSQEKSDPWESLSKRLPETPQKKLVNFMSGPWRILIVAIAVIIGVLVGRKLDPESVFSEIVWTSVGVCMSLFLISLFLFVAGSMISEVSQEKIANLLFSPGTMFLGTLGVILSLVIIKMSEPNKYHWILFGSCVVLLLIDAIFLEAVKGNPPEKLVNSMSGPWPTIIGFIFAIGGGILVWKFEDLVSGEFLWIVVGFGIGLLFIRKILPEAGWQGYPWERSSQVFRPFLIITGLVFGIGGVFLDPWFKDRLLNRLPRFFVGFGISLFLIGTILLITGNPSMP